MDDVSFSKVREAIEIADRIEKLKKFVFERQKELIHTIGAVRAVNVERDELQNYFHYDQIRSILYRITTPDKDWDVGRCCGEICTALRK